MRLSERYPFIKEQYVGDWYLENRIGVLIPI